MSQHKRLTVNVHLLTKLASLLITDKASGMAEDYSFACTHWALGSLVLVGLAASEFSGAGTIVALPIAAIAINLSGKTIMHCI